jgi:tetratricopeptide (TPR) repeat protein
MGLKTQLIDLLDKAYDMERDFLGTLSDAERSAPGTVEHWGVKDTIAHLAAWDEHLAKTLAEAAKGITPTFSNDIDQVNAEIWQRNCQRSWDEIWEYAETSYRRMVTLLEQYDDEALRNPALYPWLEGRPLWRRFIGNGYMHVVMHLASCLTARGDVQRVARMYEEEGAALDPLEDSPTWHGLNRYNIACGYALAGQKEKAIQLLGEALQLNPSLVAWSKDDPDFASLRQEPGYRALYAN